MGQVVCAEYSGRGPKDASKYLDKSQGKRGFRRSNPGHPRNHASIPNSTSSDACVENYSLNGTKSGFLSRSEQDYVGHYVLQHPRVRRELDVLNRYSEQKSDDNIRRSVNIGINDLNMPKDLQAGKWVNGVKVDTFQMNTITIVLQHFEGEENNPDAPVHILTFFPRY